MRQVIVALFDRVSQNHMPPFVQPNVDTARRSMRHALAVDKELAKNVHDYDLYLLGEYDTESGHIDNVTHKHLFALNQVLAEVSSEVQ